MITLDQLYSSTRIIPKLNLEKFIKPLNDGFTQYNLNTPLRQVHFLAQVAHESDDFQAQAEYADGSDYEGRDDLGNCKPGDGKCFKGRGLIQITRRSNYAAVSKALNFDFIAQPAKLEVIPFCVLSAFWYWDSHNLNALADRDDLEAITEAINGGLNGLDDRRAYLVKFKQALGA